jgi:hypothetical protein
MEAKKFTQGSGGRRLPTPEQEEEFMLLMSLSLDNLADAGEAAQFEEYLTRYPTFVIQWQSWQRLQQQFVAIPHAEPAFGFVDRFEVRLTQQERRRRLWLGFLIGSVTLLLWVGVVVGIFSMGTYLFTNQGSWLSALVQNLTYSWVNLVHWANTGWETFVIFASTPQAQAIGVGYLLMSVALLGGWLTILRRSLHLQELPSSATVV